MEQTMIENQKEDGTELDNRFLIFEVAGMFYSVELCYVLEIITAQQPTRLPHLPEEIRGIINLRGKVIPVVDMRIKLGLDATVYTDKTCIVVVEVDEMQVGLIVESVIEVITVMPNQTAATPADGTTPRFVGSVSNINSRAILNIDCAKLF